MDTPVAYTLDSGPVYFQHTEIIADDCLVDYTAEMYRPSGTLVSDSGLFSYDPSNQTLTVQGYSSISYGRTSYKIDFTAETNSCTLADLDGQIRSVRWKIFIYDCAFPEDSHAYIIGFDPYEFTAE